MILEWKLVDLVSLMDHARTSKKWRKKYGQKHGAPALWLVKDDGIYLMSNGEPAQIAENDLGLMPPKGQRGRCKVVYAEGHRPEDNDYPDDDYVEAISLKDFDAMVDECCNIVQINITPAAMEISGIKLSYKHYTTRHGDKPS